MAEPGAHCKQDVSMTTLRSVAVALGSPSRSKDVSIARLVAVTMKQEDGVQQRQDVSVQRTTLPAISNEIPPKPFTQQAWRDDLSRRNEKDGDAMPVRW